MSDDWLHDIADADECSLHEAAAALVENGVTISVKEWHQLTTKSRAVLTVSRHASRAAALDRDGRDMEAARVYSAVDGGRSAARLMARAAGEGAALAIRQAAQRG